MNKQFLRIALLICVFAALLTVSAAADLVYYHVTGGNISFDTATGTVTGCNNSVTEANIPAEINGVSVTTIGVKAFLRCSSLMSITIPNSVTTISSHAFYECSSLTSITIPASVTTIGVFAFYDCGSLTSITIPASVTTIDHYTFCGCGSLRNITIPASVTTIGTRAFEDCSSLTDVYYTGTETQWNAISIQVYNEPLINATIHYNAVPPQSASNNGRTLPYTGVEDYRHVYLIIFVLSGLCTAGAYWKRKKAIQ